MVNQTCDGDDTGGQQQHPGINLRFCPQMFGNDFWQFTDAVGVNLWERIDL